MAGVLYDYLIGIIIMGIIFMSAVFVVPQISYINLLHLDQQQLRNIASETLKAILLQAGYPEDWGAVDPFDQEGVLRFGLAASNSSSFYVLDPDKVQRLVEDNPLGSIEYEKMRELLNLQGYGFSLSIMPPFNVTVEIDEFENGGDAAEIELEAHVSSRNGMPIANAVVESTIIYSTEKGENTYMYYITDKYSTDSLGKCRIEKHINSPNGEKFSDIILVFKITVADLSTLLVTYQSIPPSNIANISIVEDNVILTSDQIPTPHGARWIDNIVIFGSNTFSYLYSGTRDPLRDKLTYGKGFRVWNHTFRGLKNSNPAFLLFSFWVPIGQGQGRRTILIAGPSPNWLGSRVLHYGGFPTSSSSSVKITRNVVISGMTYVVELTMWKETA
jgi:hypothetical protein